MVARIDIELVEGDVSTPGHVIERLAVKAVLMRHGKLLMLRSRHGDYKFPGGGQEAGETPEEALTRELREECGLTGARFGQTLVQVRERRPAHEPDTVFCMLSDYVAAYLPSDAAARTIDPLGGDLDPYEQELELTAKWVAPEIARAANTRLLEHLDAATVAADLPWLERETRVLTELLHRASAE